MFSGILVAPRGSNRRWLNRNARQFVEAIHHAFGEDEFFIEFVGTTTVFGSDLDLVTRGAMAARKNAAYLANSGNFWVPVVYRDISTPSEWTDYVMFNGGKDHDIAVVAVCYEHQAQFATQSYDRVAVVRWESEVATVFYKSLNHDVIITWIRQAWRH